MFLLSLENSKKWILFGTLHRAKQQKSGKSNWIHDLCKGRFFTIHRWRICWNWHLKPNWFLLKYPKQKDCLEDKIFGLWLTHDYMIDVAHTPTVTIPILHPTYFIINMISAFPFVLFAVGVNDEKKKVQKEKVSYRQSFLWDMRQKQTETGPGWIGIETRYLKAQ